MIACMCNKCGLSFDAEPQGGHRLMCGSSTSVADVATLTRGEQADLLFTSPPYGQQRDYTTGGIGDWDALMQGVFSIIPMAPSGQVLVNLGLIHKEAEWQPYWTNWIEWMRAHGWRRFGWYVWDQGPGLPGDWNGRLAPSFEFVFHFNVEAKRARKTRENKHAGKALTSGGLRSADGSIKEKTGVGKAIQHSSIPDNVFRVSRHRGGLGAAGKHPAPFPVALCTEIVMAFSDPGDVLFEPFCGSGTTIISAEQNGRRVMAMELAPIYVDVAVRRFQLFADASAILDGDGRTFEQISIDRAGGAK